MRPLDSVWTSLTGILLLLSDVFFIVYATCFITVFITVLPCRVMFSYAHQGYNKEKNCNLVHGLG